MPNPGHTRPGSLRPGFTRLPDGRGRMVVFSEKLAAGEQFRANLRLDKGTLYSAAERVDCTGPRQAHLAELRLVEDGTQQTAEGWFYVRTYEELHPTAETLAGRARVTRGDDGRLTVEQDSLQYSSAKATPQRIGVTPCPTWPVALTGITGTASTDTLALTAHGLLADDPIRFSALTGGAGLTLDITYYVISTDLTADAFKVSINVGGAAVNFTTELSAATAALYLTPLLAEELAPDDGTLRRITRRYVTEGVVATSERQIGGGMKEVTWTSVLVREDPPGVLVGDVGIQKPFGVPVYTVTVRQSTTGTDLLAAGVVSSVGLETQFEYPGRCKFSTRTGTFGTVDFRFKDLYLSPPVSATVDAQVEVRYAWRSSLSQVDVSGSAGTNAFTLTAHGLPNGWPVHFKTLTGGAPLTKNTTYYLVNVTTDTFQLATSAGGSPIDLTTDTTLAVLVPYAKPRWNPSAWAVLDAFYILYNDVSGARSKVEGLRGYRIEEEDPVDYQSPTLITAPTILIGPSGGSNPLDVAFGNLVLTGFGGAAAIYGGPPKPGGLTWTLSAKPEEAFVDGAGVPIYRHTIISAFIPEQDELPADS